jgi:hypothetical protein
MQLTCSDAPDYTLGTMNKMVQRRKSTPRDDYRPGRTLQSRTITPMAACVGWKRTELPDTVHSWPTTGVSPHALAMVGSKVEQSCVNAVRTAAAKATALSMLVNMGLSENCKNAPSRQVGSGVLFGEFARVVPVPRTHATTANGRPYPDSDRTSWWSHAGTVWHAIMVQTIKETGLLAGWLATRLGAIPVGR